MNIDDILELLKIDAAGLNEILDACGWAGKVEFSDDEAETLLAVKVSHDEKDREYVDAYLRNIAHRAEISRTQYEQIIEAITQSGGTPPGYRDQFWQICQRVKDGVSPAEAIVPPQPVVEDTPPVVDPIAQSVEMEAFISTQAQAAIAVTIAQIKGFADLAYEEQERLKNLFMTEYRRGLAKELLSPEFKAEFMQRMTASLEGGEKKPGELTGVPNPPPLLSSSN